MRKETVPEREDRRRVWTMWALLVHEFSGASTDDAIALIETAVVGPFIEPTPQEATAIYRIDRFEDHFPEPDAWRAARARVLRYTALVIDNKAAIDAVIVQSSPKWRIERMPLIDRTLLRMGVAELAYVTRPRPRATINGLIELAKSFGEDSSHRFINGILDQIRRDLDIPFDAREHE